MGIYDTFKQCVLNIRKKVEEFKDNHKMASEAVSVIMDELPFPLGTFGRIIWNGLEKEDNASEKMLQILEKIEKTDEVTFMRIIGDISKLIEKSEKVKDHILEIGEQIRTSNQSIVKILDSKLDEILLLSKKIEQTTQQTYELVRYGPNLETVSYTLLEVNQGNPNDTLQKIAAAINFQLSEDLPFVPFKGFDNTKKKDRLFLYGLKGCGTSRVMIELIKEKIKNFKNIYIINPQLKEEEKRIKIRELVEKVNEKDAIIWDNFPEGLLDEWTLELVRDALAKLSMDKVRNLFVALNPELYEKYRTVPSEFLRLQAYEIAYDEETIKNVVKSYGKVIPQYKELYDKFIEKDVDKISEILWEKQPTPYTVFLYYKELKNKIEESVNGSLDAVKEAEDLPLPTEYFKNQFEIIRNERPREAEFLYTLKLSYELGLKRDISNINKLQEKIFKSIYDVPEEKLSSWVYISPYNDFVMRNMARDAIKFDSIKWKIMSYLTRNFFEVIPNEENAIYSFGIFFGKNIQSIPRDSSHPFLPDDIYDYMKNKKRFEEGLAQGIGETFHFIDNKELQQELLRRAEEDTIFARRLSYSLGQNFKALDRELQDNIWELAEEDTIFARSLSYSLSDNFATLNKERQQELLRRAEEDTIFARRLGYSLGQNFKALDRELQDNIWELAEEDSEFARRLGYSLGHNFAYLTKELQQEILRRLEEDKEFARSLGYNLGDNFAYLTKELQQEILRRAEKDTIFAFSLGTGLGDNFAYLTKELQQELLRRVEEDSEFARRLSYSLGRNFKALDRELQDNIWELAGKDSIFARRLGYNLGDNFAYLTKELQQEILRRAEKDTIFAFSLGYSLGRNFKALDRELQDNIWELAGKDSEFARRLSYSLSDNFAYLRKELQQEILDRVEKDSEFARRLGYSLSDNFAYLPKELQQEILRRAEKEEAITFALSLGAGLGRNFKALDRELQDNIWELAGKNSAFADGLSYILSDNFASLNKELQQEILRRAEEDSIFAFTLVHGLGRNFKALGRDLQDDIRKIAERNPSFARRLVLD